MGFYLRFEVWTLYFLFLITHLTILESIYTVQLFDYIIVHTIVDIRGLRFEMFAIEFGIIWHIYCRKAPL